MMALPAKAGLEPDGRVCIEYLAGRPALRRRSADVGIVWGIRDDMGKQRFVIDSTPFVEAEPYGDFLTHPRGHYEVWEVWRHLGPAGLVRRGLPAIIVWHEYEHFPRGRLVFDTQARRFTLYADRKLQGPATLLQVLGAFHFDAEFCNVRSDQHYLSAAEWRDSDMNVDAEHGLN